MTGAHFHRFWLTAITLLALWPATAFAQISTSGRLRVALPPVLSPTATFGTKIHDSMGFQWDINPQGHVQSGSKRCFSGAGALQVGGSSFSSSQQMMSPDGKEYVLTGSRSGVGITRRVRVDVKTATLRYVETFHNPKTTPVNLEVRIVTSMRSSVGAVMTNSGKMICSSGNQRIIGTSSSSATVPVLGEKDCGLLVTRTSTSYPAVLFYLAASKSKLKPTLQRSGSSSFVFRYQVLIPPKKTVSIVHGLAQRNIQGTPDAKTLAKHFKPFQSRKWTGSLPLAVRRSILNSGRSHYLDETPRSPLIQPVLNLAAHWDVERGKTDVLVQGEETRISGAISGSSLTVETRYGKTVVPLDEVAVLTGGNGIGRQMRLYLRNGEILVGSVKTDKMTLESESGLEVELTPKHVNTVFMHAEEADGKGPPEAVAMVKTHHGDQLALKADSPSKIVAATAWGPIEVSLDEIDYLYPIREPQPVHRLILHNKSRLSVILDGSELELATLRFGPLKMAPGAIARLASVKAKVGSGNEEEEELHQPHCRLLDNNIVVATVDAARLDLLTAAGVTPLDTSQLRLMERQDEDEESANPTFSFELANGTKLVGRLRDGVFPLRALGKVWHVPTYHVLCFRRPEQIAVVAEEAEPGETEKEGSAEERPVEPAPHDEPVPELPVVTPSLNDPFGADVPSGP